MSQDTGAGTANEQRPAPPPEDAIGPRHLVRAALAVVLVVFVPLRVLVPLDDGLGRHELTGWFGHLLLSVPGALVVAAVLWPLAWLLVRPWSGLSLLVAMFAVCSAPANGWLLTGYLNVVLDHAPSEIVQLHYVAHKHHGKGPDEDMFVSWRGANDIIALQTVSVPKKVPGATVRVRLHRGWLGMEWIEANIEF
jgi:hypothetical protein